MKNNQQLYTLVVVVLVALAGLKYLRKSHMRGANEVTPTVVTPGNRAGLKPAPVASQVRPSPTVAPGRWSQDPLHPGVMVDAKSEAIRREFLNLAHLDVKLPKDYVYQKLDISEDVAGIRGKDPLNKVSFAVLAKRGTASPSDISAFLGDQGNLIPGFDGHGHPSLGEPRQLEPKEGSGLDSVSYWDVKKGDESVRVVFANRKDGQGSYLMVVDGNSNKIDAQEGRFEDMMDNLKAK